MSKLSGSVQGIASRLNSVKSYLSTKSNFTILSLNFNRNKIGAEPMLFKWGITFRARWWLQYGKHNYCRAFLKHLIFDSYYPFSSYLTSLELFLLIFRPIKYAVFSFIYVTTYEKKRLDCSKYSFLYQNGRQLGAVYHQCTQIRHVNRNVPNIQKKKSWKHSQLNSGETTCNGFVTETQINSSGTERSENRVKTCH